MNMLPYLDNLAFLLSALPSDRLGDMLHRFAVELSTRGDFEAAHDVRRAVAMLLRDHPRVQALPATTEPPKGV